MRCSWELYWASVEYRNWYCSVVWIIPPLHRTGEEGDYRLDQMLHHRQRKKERK